MRPGISLTVTAADRCRLAVIAGDRNTPQKHVWRAEIVLLTADGIGTVEIMRRTGKSKTCEGTRRSACGMVAPGPNSWLAACAGMLRCSMPQRVYSASVPEAQAFPGPGDDAQSPAKERRWVAPFTRETARGRRAGATPSATANRNDRPPAA